LCGHTNSIFLFVGVWHCIIYKPLIIHRRTLYGQECAFVACWIYSFSSNCRKTGGSYCDGMSRKSYTYWCETDV